MRERVAAFSLCGKLVRSKCQRTVRQTAMDIGDAKRGMAEEIEPDRRVGNRERWSELNEEYRCSEGEVGSQVGSQWGRKQEGGIKEEKGRMGGKCEYGARKKVYGNDKTIAAT